MDDDTIKLITTQRQHLFDISHILVGGIDPVFWQDRCDPVIITVRGSQGDGKKIIPDAAVEKIFGIPDAREKEKYKKSLLRFWSKVTYKGHDEYDEYWTGNYKGRPLQVDFINVAWGCDYTFHSFSTLDDSHPARRLLFLRKHGGLSFIHNSNYVAKDASWLDIVIEKPDSAGLVNSSGESFLKKETGRLKEVFDAQAHRSDWTRYIRIEPRREALMQSEMFQRALKQLRNEAPLFGAKVTNDNSLQYARAVAP